MPNSRVPVWYRWAECRKHPELEFVPSSTNPRLTYPEQRAICAGCGVRKLCLDEALAYGPDLRGIWAGTDERERRRMLKAREAA